MESYKFLSAGLAAGLAAITSLPGLTVQQNQNATTSNFSIGGSVIDVVLAYRLTGFGPRFSLPYG